MLNIMTNSLLRSLLLVSLVVFSSSQKYDLSAPSSICIDESACNCTLVGSNRYKISCNFSTRDYTIDANSLPPTSYEVEITEGGNVVFDARSFSKLPFLARVNVRRVKSLVFKRESFVNLLANHLRVEISDTNKVEMEPKSFYLLKGPVSYSVIRCAQLTIHTDAVPWIQTLNVSQVARVELHENSLSQTSEKIVTYHQGYSTKINMHNVSMDELPKNSFPSSAAEVRLSECRIKLARKNCFSAVELYAVYILNSSFDVIETEAFSERSLLRILHFSNVSIGQIQTGAIQSAVTNFKISQSHIDTIETEAFHMSTTLTVHFANNVFLRIKENGITLQSWTKTTIENNTLRDLDEGAINLPSWDETNNAKDFSSIRQFHFIGNILQSLKLYSLKLIRLSDHTGGEILIKENIFIQPCDCERPSFLDTYILTKNNFVIESMYNSSYCAVNSMFAKCFQQHANKNFMRMTIFSELVCRSQDTSCLEETTPSYTAENPNIVKAVLILNEDKRNYGGKHALVIVVVAVAVVGVLVIIILTLVCKWLCKGKGKFRPIPSCFTNAFLSLYSRLTTISCNGNLGRATSANSIARVSIHEYAEVGPQKLFDVGDEEDRIYIIEDKATQTLPEELTQELLQVLREKLDDPQDYKEARHMIEHLYDLIKVEECCNNNTLDDEVLDFCGHDEDDLAYDVITPSKAGTGPRVRRYDKSIKKLANKGTRAPSPDKLSPRTFIKPPAPIPESSSYSLQRQQQQMCVGDYAEPSDRRESNIYSELMDVGCRSPSLQKSESVIVNEYAEPRDFIIPIYSELDDDIDVVVGDRYLSSRLH